MSLLSDFRELKWFEWLYMLIAAAISAAATPITANPIATLLGVQQFTAGQLGIMALSSAIVAIAAFLKKSPLPDRAVAIALLQGMRTPEQVEKVMRATAPGTVPTPAVAAAIINGSKKENA